MPKPSPRDGDMGKGKSFPLGCSSQRDEPPSWHHGAGINQFPTKTMLLLAFLPPTPPPVWGLAAMGTGRWHAQLRLRGEVTSPLGTWPLPQHLRGEVLWGWARGTESSSHGVAVLTQTLCHSCPPGQRGGSGAKMAAALSFLPTSRYPRCQGRVCAEGGAPREGQNPPTSTQR